MTFNKRNNTHLLNAIVFFALVFLLLLKLRADVPSLDQEETKRYGMTNEEHNVYKARLEELRREYYMASKSSERVDQIQAILKKAIANIDSASMPFTTNGGDLPASFTDFYYPQQPKASSELSSPDAMMAPGFMGLKKENLIDQQTLAFVLHLSHTDPEILLPVLQERAKSSSPTVADYILYMQVYLGVSDPDNVPLPQRCVDLLQLAKAKNPVYRLLAAKVALYVEPDTTRRLNFYSTFLNETDLYIQDAAIEGVIRTKAPGALDILQSFQAMYQKKGNVKAEAWIQEQIKKLKQ